MAQLPDIPRPGEPLRAAWGRQVVEFLRARLNFKAGAGIAVKADADGTVISLEKAIVTPIVRARITASPAAPDGDLPPDQCVYSAGAYFMPEEVVGRVPDIGRPVDAARIIPAAEGDLCFIVNALGEDGSALPLLWVPTERVATYDCAAAAERAMDDRAEQEFRRLVEAVVVELGERGLVVAR